VLDKNRNKRLRLLIKKLNKDRKKQGQKIDILCNDLIAAQRDFLKKLKTLTFAANFYESIIGTTDLNNLLQTASGLIKKQVEGANIIFFLRHEESFEQYAFENEQVVNPAKQHFESCFGPELVENICSSKKVCTIEDMFAMGLQGNLIELNKISAVTVPLYSYRSLSGFILIYQTSPKKLTTEEISNIIAVGSGLSTAIASCRELLHTSD
jgi:transcriptional regulator with GAF, ATPase, and Fis domain